jgi:phosphatidylglycerophosphate synthase
MMSAQIKNRVSEMFAVQRYIAVCYILASQGNKYSIRNYWNPGLCRVLGVLPSVFCRALDKEAFYFAPVFKYIFYVLICLLLIVGCWTNMVDGWLRRRGRRSKTADEADQDEAQQAV